ncbi:HAD-like domain-containing protein [Mycena polygramma]|nr:HAD-like domain-containing protein [Mycena polygramma]
MEPDEPDEYRFTWALIQPSAVETVAHLNSHFATAAAHRLEFPQYLALIEELPPTGEDPEDWIAFLAQPASSDRIPPPATLADGQLAQANGFDYPWDVEEEAGLSEPMLLATPPLFDPTCVRVIYFDVYDTLIDRETGIFSALQPLLNQSRYAFTRHEALSFYFESEMEMKERTPRAPYAQILADTYRDVALRLGIAPVSATDVSLFARSADNWPCIPDAEWLLSIWHHEFLLRTPAFASLAPFFDTLFTWDACHAYKPDPSVFYAPLRLYDAHGVPRAHSVLVSGSILRDLEPARELGLPAVWIQTPGSLAANLPSVEDACPAGSFSSLFNLGTALLEASGPLAIDGDQNYPDLHTDMPPDCCFGMKFGSISSIYW